MDDDQRKAMFASMKGKECYPRMNKNEIGKGFSTAPNVVPEYRKPNYHKMDKDDAENVIKTMGGVKKIANNMWAYPPYKERFQACHTQAVIMKTPDGYYKFEVPTDAKGMVNERVIAARILDIADGDVKSPTMLMTKELRNKLPPLYSTEKKKPEEVTVYAHYFTPFSNIDWYVTEFDGKEQMFGLVKGYEVELGYINLKELESQGMNVERDLHWNEKTLAEVMKETNYPYYKPQPVLKAGEKMYTIELLDTDTGGLTQIIEKIEVPATSENKAQEKAWQQYSQRYNLNAARSTDPRYGRYVLLSGKKE